MKLCASKLVPGLLIVAHQQMYFYDGVSNDLKYTQNRMKNNTIKSGF
jgi:hypothetical protein